MEPLRETCLCDMFDNKLCYIDLMDVLINLRQLVEGSYDSILGTLVSSGSKSGSRRIFTRPAFAIARASGSPFILANFPQFTNRPRPEVPNKAT